MASLHPFGFSPRPLPVLSPFQAQDWEVDAACQVQNRTFPASRPSIPGLEYDAAWRPARGLSGDYLDYYRTPQGDFHLAVGDVAGKGLPAALLASSLHSTLRALETVGWQRLPKLVERVDELFGEVCPDGCFATLFVACFEPESRRLRYINAGHEPPFVLRRTRTGRRPIQLDPGGPVIGMLRHSVWREGSLTLDPGDLLVAYTDGLCDTTDPGGAEWGWRRLVCYIAESADRPVRDIVEGVIETVEVYSRGRRSDDITLWIGRARDESSLETFATAANAETPEAALSAAA
ncbi:MAG: PP2C family protein-serine/threonine phosphatase [Bryobacteraceae bacterium]